jgi:class 3 adenylate cyclase
MVALNAAAPGDNRIEFRIGVHQGDIVVEDDDIFGDGVNVAVRACYAQMGKLGEAGRFLDRLRTITDAIMPASVPFRNPEQRELYLSGLRLAASDSA